MYIGMTECMIPFREPRLGQRINEKFSINTGHRYESVYLASNNPQRDWLFCGPRHGHCARITGLIWPGQAETMTRGRGRGSGDRSSSGKFLDWSRC